VAVIGLDCALPHLIEKHIAEGHLPTFKKLISEGLIADNCLVPYPTVTPPNWATIATGAWAGTHCITDFHSHIPGTDLENINVVEAFNSERCHAEFIWDVLDSAGKKCVVLNYPGSWPSKMKNGVMVGGAGLTVSDWRDGLIALNSYVSVCSAQLITTGIYPRAIKTAFQEAQGWTNVPEMGDEPLEMEVNLAFPSAKEEPEAHTWYVLVRQTGGDEYDRATLSPTKDFNDAFFTLAVGEWSENIITNIKMKDGSEREVAFISKLIELSDDAEDFRLLISAMIETSGWSSPAEVAKEISFEEGLPHPGGGMTGVAIGWYGQDTYVEMTVQHDIWLGNAAAALLKKQDWDLFYMHAHPPDWVYHAIITDMDPATCPDEARRNKAWDTHLKVYQSQDRMIARILEVVDEETLVILVSDHGATADGPVFNPYKPLENAGLTVMKEKAVAAEGSGALAETLALFTARPDMKASRAIPQREIHVYVNLKGRDPDGIVEPEDYQKVQQEIIEALITYVDPGTGKRPVALALSKQDARILGLYGDYIGDVIYAIYPWFGSQHGQILPTVDWGVGSLKGLFTMAGPGVKKNHRLQRTAWLTDIVPTLCYLMDWPLPAQAEGAVLYQAFEDLNFKLK
ncbi:MAG: alkaline phosphatase family protein, partial [Deltaproteobacteria bacterium]|nr:alkaline phosphatase family protein [Deltaproteobacteria bacterium]